MGQPLKAVIFDFDGVLVDSVPAYRQAVTEAVGNTGVADDGVDNLATSDTRTVARRIIKKYNLDVGVETLAQQVEKFVLDRLLGFSCVVDGARELLESVRNAGLKTAIASMGPRRNIETVLQQAGIANLFDAIVAYEDIENVKPDPEVFLKAAEALDVAGGDCIAIEDSQAGVSAANAAGMTTIALTTTLPADRLHHAHLIVERLTDLTLDKLQQVHKADKRKS